MCSLGSYWMNVSVPKYHWFLGTCTSDESIYSVMQSVGNSYKTFHEPTTDKPHVYESSEHTITFSRNEYVLSRCFQN